MFFFWLFKDYICTYWQVYPRQGTLYITENFLCFHWSKEKIIIAIKEIVALNKEMTAMGLFHNSIKIKTTSNQEVMKKRGKNLMCSIRLRLLEEIWCLLWLKNCGRRLCKSCWMVQIRMGQMTLEKGVKMSGKKG